MSAKPIEILLIEDSRSDERQLRVSLCPVADHSYGLTTVSRVSEAVSYLAKTTPAAILLDLSLQDGGGLAALRRTHEAAPDVPIIALVGLEEEELAARSLEEGAQDYLIKGLIDRRTMERAFRYALERQELRASHETVSLKDELTGLYNRRGFFQMASRHFEIVKRNPNTLLLVSASLEGWKEIKERLGQQEGNCALREAAEVLTGCFRRTDMVARLGDDEFGALAIDATAPSEQIVLQRIERRARARSAGEGRRYALSLSAGAKFWKAGQGGTVEELFAEAEAEMRRQKARRRAARCPVVLDAPATQSSP